MTPDEALARLDVYREHRKTRDADVVTALTRYTQKEVKEHSGLSRQWIARIAADAALNQEDAVKPTIEKISDNFWDVTDADGNALGTILGDGPTRTTRYKGIRPSKAADNPEDVDGFYGASLEEVAGYLARS